MEYYTALLQLLVSYYALQLYLSYEYLVQKLQDKKNKYMIQHKNLKTHKEYLLGHIEEVRENVKKSSTEHNKLSFEMMTLNEKYEEEKNKNKQLENKLKQFKKLKEDRDRLFLENEQRKYQMNKKDSWVYF